MSNKPEAFGSSSRGFQAIAVVPWDQKQKAAAVLWGAAGGPSRPDSVFSSSPPLQAHEHRFIRYPLFVPRYLPSQRTPPLPPLPNPASLTSHTVRFHLCSDQSHRDSTDRVTVEIPVLIISPPTNRPPSIQFPSRRRRATTRPGISLVLPGPVAPFSAFAAILLGLLWKPFGHLSLPGLRTIAFANSPPSRPESWANLCSYPATDPDCLPKDASYSTPQ
ncbi:uncharacterized protein CLUP02_16499 [Colletotrichum lupini]|uniref:Uncharacterized protein n=1 Tax=Colletotrichum lupini TaxID=145971 RepID=A0A9Q8WQ18_9PEZI|nr:uncharacterized protein CLUP02_16499 [Colletotrichum lupini]UQC90967.1 hypothetical protein CLUP02_16499 [Colletotrichum lupini]